MTSLKVFINTIFSKNYFNTSRIYKRLKVKFTFTKKLNITKGPNLTVFHGLIISSKPSSLSRCIKNENLKSLHVIFRNVSISAISSYWNVTVCFPLVLLSRKSFQDLLNHKLDVGDAFFVQFPLWCKCQDKKPSRETRAISSWNVLSK